MNRSRGGFSLVKLLIVIATIVIIAAVAVPKVTEGRCGGTYEMAAIRNLNTLNNAQIQYFSTYGRYAQTLIELGPPLGNTMPASAGANLIPEGLSTGIHSGYVFTMAGPPAGYTVNADPITTTHGNLHLFADTSGMIRQRSGGTAGEIDSEIQ